MSEREGETDRQTDRQTDTERDRERGGRGGERERERERERENENEREREFFICEGNREAMANFSTSSSCLLPGLHCLYNYRNVIMRFPKDKTKPKPRTSN